MYPLSQLKRFCALLALACTLPASAAVIDFDGSAAPLLFSESTTLTDQYGALGVSFAGATGVGGAILDQGAEFGFPARSGSNFLAFNLDASVGPDERISFAAVQNTVSVFAATFEEASFTMSAFDGSGNLLGSTTLAGSRDWQELTLALAGIRSVVVSSTAFGWALDDLTFSGAPGEVPEPATLGLMGLGLAGALAARRKRAVRA